MIAHVLVVITLLSANESEGALMPLLRIGNQSSRESIKTIHARYTVQSTLMSINRSGIDRINNTNIEWWQNGKRIKYVQNEITDIKKPKEINNKALTALKNEVHHSSSASKDVRLQRQQNGNSEPSSWTGRIMPPGTKYDGVTDLWKRSLWEEPTGDKQNVSIADLIMDSTIDKKIALIMIEGMKYYQLTLIMSSKSTTELLFDPRHNFLVVKRVVTGPVSWIEENVISIQEAAPGIYFPKKVTMLVHMRSPQGEEFVFIKNDTEFTLVEINQDIPIDRLMLELPPGTAVINEFNNTSYVLGKDGQPIGRPDVAPSDSSLVDVDVPKYVRLRHNKLLIMLSASVALVVALSILVLRMKRRIHSE